MSPVTIKLERMTAYDKDPQTSNSPVLLNTWSQLHQQGSKCSYDRNPWRNTHVVNKKSYIFFCNGHGHQGRQGNGLWYWAPIDKVMWFLDHLMLCSLMTNKNCYTSNSAIFLPTGFLLAWKSSSVKLFFCYRALIFAQYHNFPDKFVCWSCWFTIWDSQSRIKLMTGTPVKFWRQ